VLLGRADRQDDAVVPLQVLLDLQPVKISRAYQERSSSIAAIGRRLASRIGCYTQPRAAA
jgi:hypothetical protein